MDIGQEQNSKGGKYKMKKKINGTNEEVITKIKGNKEIIIKNILRKGRNEKGGGNKT